MENNWFETYGGLEWIKENKESFRKEMSSEEFRRQVMNDPDTNIPEELKRLIPPENEKWGVIIQYHDRFNWFVKDLSKKVGIDLRNRFIAIVREDDIRGREIKKAICYNYNGEIIHHLERRGCDIIDL